IRTFIRYARSCIFSRVTQGTYLVVQRYVEPGAPKRQREVHERTSPFLVERKCYRSLTRTPAEFRTNSKSYQDFPYPTRYRPEAYQRNIKLLLNFGYSSLDDG